MRVSALFDGARESKRSSATRLALPREKVCICMGIDRLTIERVHKKVERREAKREAKEEAEPRHEHRRRPARRGAELVEPALHAGTRGEREHLQKAQG